MTHVLSGQWTEGEERGSYGRAPHALSRLSHRTSVRSPASLASLKRRWSGLGSSRHCANTAGRNWVVLLCLCTSYHSSWHMVGAHVVSAEALLAEAEAVESGSARREPKTS